MSSYQKLIERLFQINLNGGVKLGLNNMERACAALGHPEKSFKSVHVAGTNGKGSVSTKIAKNLGGGLFTSPHIASFRERISIDGKMIPIDAVERILPQLFELMPLTFFEITTLLAMIYFAEKGVNWAVFEVGLGGRFDATNVISPELSVITSISFDHTEILGDTLEKIAFEKGGIIKSGIPVVLGPRCPEILKAMANEKGSPFIQVDGAFKNYDEENSAIAKSALKLLNINEPNLSMRPRCRFEIHGDVVLDAAHNPDGAAELVKMLDQSYPRQQGHFIIGLSKSKDIDGYLKIIAPKAKSITFVEAKNGRGADPKVLMKKAAGSRVCSSIKEALDLPGLKVVTGTFFIMNEAIEAIGLKMESDAVDMNERIVKL